MLYASTNAIELHSMQINDGIRIKIESDQNEPLIFIADYIAGICNSLFGAGKVSAPAGLHLDDVKIELDKIKDSGKIVVIGEKFDLDFKEIFTNFDVI